MAREMTPEQIRASIVPKSDQINADDLIAGPVTVTVAGVSEGSTEQPWNIRLHEVKRVFRPCKAMRRWIVELWGDNSNKWIGRRMTLYRDPSALFGGVAVGGVRISHMSDIDGPREMTITLSKNKRIKATVLPLPPAQQSAPTQKQDLAHEVLTFGDQSWSRSSRGAQEWANAIGKAAAELVSAGDTAGARAVFAEYGPQLEDVLSKLPANATAAIAAIGAVLAYGENLGSD